MSWMLELDHHNGPKATTQIGPAGVTIGTLMGCDLYVRNGPDILGRVVLGDDVPILVYRSGPQQVLEEGKPIDIGDALLTVFPSTQWERRNTPDVSAEDAPTVCMSHGVSDRFQWEGQEDDDVPTEPLTNKDPATHEDRLVLETRSSVRAVIQMGLALLVGLVIGMVIVPNESAPTSTPSVEALVDSSQVAPRSHQRQFSSQLDGAVEAPKVAEAQSGDPTRDEAIAILDDRALLVAIENEEDTSRRSTLEDERIRRLQQISAKGRLCGLQKDRTCLDAVRVRQSNLNGEQ